METELNILNKMISSYNSAVVAFSGGVDSAFLAKYAKNILKENVILVTISFAAISKQELNASIRIAKELSLKQKIIHINEVDIPHFNDNPPDRCFYCKKHIFEAILQYSKSIGYDVVLEGSNVDDLKDYRPGRKALQELNIVSPLLEAGLTKEKIRLYSSNYNLSTSLKPSYSCLATRIPYGEKITRKKLMRIAEAEKGIISLGFTQFRVRNHGKVARLEFISEEIERAWKLREILSEICCSAGYLYSSIDCTGYKTGKLNLGIFEI